LWCATQIHPFLCQLADLGSHLQHAPLRDAARGLLRLLPSDAQAADKIFGACLVGAKEAAAASAPSSGPAAPPAANSHAGPPQQASATLEALFSAASPSTVLYYLEVRTKPTWGSIHSPLSVYLER